MSENTTTTDSTNDSKAIDWEKRYKDLQPAYTKSQQTLKQIEAERDVLKDLVPSMPVNLTPEQTTELEDLKYSDPDAWRVKQNEYEAQAKRQVEERTNTVLSEATSRAATEFELSRRTKILEEFNANTANPLTDEQLAYDVPPRLTKQLEEGKITFEELITKAHEFINSPKAIKDTDDVLNQPSLNDKGSGTKDNNPEVTTTKKYESSVY